jgi:hypothetical protein
MTPAEKSKLYNCVEEVCRDAEPEYLINWLEKLYDRVSALEARFSAVHLPEYLINWLEKPFEPCYVCGKLVPYESMGNGEEWALPGCAYCNQAVCIEHRFVDRNNQVCCTKCSGVE